MSDCFYYTMPPSSSIKVWSHQRLASFMEAAEECKKEAEELIQWSIEHVRLVIANEDYSCAYEVVEQYVQENLSHIKTRALDYDSYEILRNDKADIQEIIAQSVAEYLCDFRIRVNGYNEYEDGRYCAVLEIAYWFQMVYGRISTSLGECQNPDYLIWYFDTPVHGAWRTFKPTNDCLMELKARLMRPVNDLMKEHNRHSYEVTAEYLMKEYDGKTNEDLLTDIRSLMRNVECSDVDIDLMNMSSLLLRAEMYDEWIAAMEHLRYPLLQGSILCEISKPSECIALIKALEKSNDSRRLVNQAIIRQKWFECICKITVNLRDNQKKDNIDNDFLIEISTRRKAWDKNLKNEIETFMLLSKNIFGEDDTVRWVSSLPYFESDRDFLECQINNEIRDSIIDYCTDKFDMMSMNADSENIDYILILLLHAMNREQGKVERIEELMSKLFNTILITNKFFNGAKVSNDELLLLSKICKGLSFLSEDNRRKLFGQFDIWHEGYNAHKGAFVKGELNKHAFVLSAKLLLVCEDQFTTDSAMASDYFKSVVCEVMDNYIHLLHRHNDNAYLYPLIVGMLIASQKLSLDKWYVDMVVDKVDNFVDLLAILEHGKDDIDSDVRTKLQIRKNIEWPSWVVVFKDSSRIYEIQACERIITKLKLQ